MTSLGRLLMCLLVAGGLLAVGFRARADSTGPVALRTVAPAGRALRRGGVQPRPPSACDEGLGRGGERIPARHGA